MATSSNAAPTPGFAGIQKRLAPYCVPYYLSLGAVLGGITAVFVVLTLIIVLVATNFNVLGLVE